MPGTLSNYLYNNWHTNIQWWNNSKHKFEKHRNNWVQCSCPRNAAYYLWK